MEIMPRSGIISFQVTENMENIGIKDFILNRCDFEITFIRQKMLCIIFIKEVIDIRTCQKYREKIMAKY